MIQWRDALSLCALALVPALVAFFVWAQRRRQRALEVFVAAALLPAVAPDVDPRRRTVRAALLTTAAALVVLALAGPMWGFRWEQVRREGVDLVIVIDTSRSMLATDVKPNRLARAKLAVQDLVAQLHGDRVALVAFAGAAFVQCPLTLDYGAFAESLDAVEVGLIPRGGTALADAIDTGLGAFEGRQGKHQALVLITDGESHEGDVKAAVTRASERGVKVYTVGIGTSEGELIPGEEGVGFLKDRAGQVVKSRLDEKTLQEVATDTGGVYLHASGTSLGLTELYRDYIASMEKRELESTLERRYEHRYQLPLALALLLLLVEPLIGERRATRGRAWSRLRRRATATAALLAVFATRPVSAGWLDPHAEVRSANKLYDAGKFDDAATAYNQALVDQPDSSTLHFNLGDATYKQGKYEDALGAFQQVPAGDDQPARTARVAYNIGNTKYRLGEAKESSEPQAALGLWAEALAAYRRALGTAPDDADAKFNHEFVEKKIAELQKKLEEQKKQQEQKDQQQKDQQQKDQQQQQDKQDGAQQQDQKQQAGGEQQQQEQKEEPKPSPEQADQQPQEQQQAAAPEQKPGEQQKQQADGAAQAGKKDEREMSPQEATALLDAQRNDEVRPDEVVRKLQGAVDAAPAQDW